MIERIVKCLCTRLGTWSRWSSDRKQNLLQSNTTLVKKKKHNFQFENNVFHNLMFPGRATGENGDSSVCSRCVSKRSHSFKIYTDAWSWRYVGEFFWLLNLETIDTADYPIGHSLLGGFWDFFFLGHLLVLLPSSYSFYFTSNSKEFIAN